MPAHSAEGGKERKKRQSATRGGDTTAALPSKPEELRQFLFGPSPTLFTNEFINVLGPELNEVDPGSEKSTKPTPIFQPGKSIQGKSQEYKVAEAIGAFAYRVTDTKNTNYFMKVESVDMAAERALLKREVYVYDSVKGQDQKYRTHFLELVDKGRDNNFNLVVTSWAGGKNLKDLRAKAGITYGDWLKMAIQSLQAVHDIHVAGYLHRDIRPANFILNETQTLIYLVGFALSYRFFPPKKSSKHAKSIQKILVDTATYASRNYHLGLDVKREDDIEAWFYTMVDTFDPNFLPWKKSTKELERFTLKEKMINGAYDHVIPRNLSRDVFVGLRAKIAEPVPRETKKDDTRDSSNVNYQYYMYLLYHAAEQQKQKLSMPFTFSIAAPAAVHEASK